MKVPHFPRARHLFCPINSNLMTREKSAAAMNFSPPLERSREEKTHCFNLKFRTIQRTKNSKVELIGKNQFNDFIILNASTNSITHNGSRMNRSLGFWKRFASCFTKIPQKSKRSTFHTKPKFWICAVRQSFSNQTCYDSFLNESINCPNFLKLADQQSIAPKSNG